jgi:RNA polymerase sigma-70 factor, ECF subfamily
MNSPQAPNQDAAAVELAALMQEYQQGEGKAAALLVAQVSPQLFRFFLGQVRDRGRAEDLLQDLWLRVHKARRSYRPGEPVLPWIYAIARRVRIDDYRKKSRIARHEFQSEELPEIIEDTSSKTALPDMKELLQSLPAAQREAVLLLKVSGLSLEEAARATGTSVGAVKQKAHRAYQTLRKVLGGQR